MKSIGLISRIVMYVMMVVSVIFTVASFIEGNEGATDNGSWTDIAIRWTYFMCGVAIVAAVISAVFDAMNNATNIVGLLIKLVVCVALVVICWFMSDDAPISILGYEGDQNCYPWLNIADTSMFLLYIVGGACVVAAIYSAIKGLLK